VVDRVPDDQLDGLADSNSVERKSRVGIDVRCLANGYPPPGEQQSAKKRNQKEDEVINKSDVLQP